MEKNLKFLLVLYDHVKRYLKLIIIIVKIFSKEGQVSLNKKS